MAKLRIVFKSGQARLVAGDNAKVAKDYGTITDAMAKSPFVHKTTLELGASADEAGDGRERRIFLLVSEIESVGFEGGEDG